MCFRIPQQTYPATLHPNPTLTLVGGLTLKPIPSPVEYESTLAPFGVTSHAQGPTSIPCQPDCAHRGENG